MKKSGSQQSKSPSQKSPSQLIDARIKELGDWRGETLARVRSLIKAACPDVVEESKWRGVPVWSTPVSSARARPAQAAVKLTFANGALLDDPSGLFNSSLDGNVRRAIDLHEDDKINERALKKYVGAAVDHHQNKLRKKAPAATGANVPNINRRETASQMPASLHRAARGAANIIVGRQIVSACCNRSDNTYARSGRAMRSAQASIPRGASCRKSTGKANATPLSGSKRRRALISKAPTSSTGA